MASFLNARHDTIEALGAPDKEVSKSMDINISSDAEPRLARTCQFGPMKLAIAVASFLFLFAIYATILHPLLRNHRKEVELVNGQSHFVSKTWRAWEGLGQSYVSEPSVRQKMIRDLVSNKLPGLDKKGVQSLLGDSVSHEEMGRTRSNEVWGIASEDNLSVRESDGYYYDEFDWDLLYTIGLRRQSIPGDPLAPDGDPEVLLIRFGDGGLFNSWYIVGDDWWPRVVGPKGAASFYRRR